MAGAEFASIKAAAIEIAVVNRFMMISILFQCDSRMRRYS